MSNQFDLKNDLDSLCNQIDGPLLGAVPRWKRKANSNSSMATSSSFSGNQSASRLNCSSSANGRSPLHDCTRSFLENSKNAVDPRLPSKKGGKNSGSHSFSLQASKSIECGDRFIPSRANSNLETAWHKLHDKPVSNTHSSLAEDEYRRKFKENLDQVMGVNNDGRILAYGSKPNSVQGYQNKTKILFSQKLCMRKEFKVLYSSTKKVNPESRGRHIPSCAFKVMDAPELMNDYYLHLLDWGHKNLVAVGLGSSVYLWNATSGDVSQLFTMDNESDYVASLKWTSDGEYLAVGDSKNCVQLWDVSRQKRLRNMRGHTGRVNALSWNKHILSSGSLDTNIHNHDVRIAEHHVATLSGHAQDVCGIEWSQNGEFLASGGNDNVVNVFDSRNNAPVHTFTEHQAGVKAIGWCPWQANILATGGGTSDRHIRLWNTTTGVCTKAVDTKSQVCMLKWSTHYKELITSHGYSQFQLTIWSFPGMTWMKDLLGHGARVLYMTLSPDGETVCSAGADETLRLWKCFEYDGSKTKKVSNENLTRAKSLFGQNIR